MSAHSAIFEIYKQILYDIEKRLTGLSVKSERRKIVARELLAVYRKLEIIESQTGKIRELLQNYINDLQIGMRVHYVHQIGTNLDELYELFKILWLWCYQRGSSSLEPMSAYYAAYNNSADSNVDDWQDGFPSIEALSGMPSFEFTVPPKAGAETEKLRNIIQAVRSPNPKLFPQDEVINDILQETVIFLNDVTTLKSSVRNHAIKLFTIDDVFG